MVWGSGTIDFEGKKDGGVAGVEAVVAL